MSPAEALQAKIGSGRSERLYCDCQDARVGACFTGNVYGYFYAVSEDSCSDAALARLFKRSRDCVFSH